MVVYPIIHRVLYIPGGAGFLPPTSKSLPVFFGLWQLEIAGRLSSMNDPGDATEDRQS